MDEVCVCKNPPPEMVEAMRAMGKDVMEGHEETGYVPFCGKCRDPCSLKWMMHKTKEEEMMDDQMMDEAMSMGNTGDGGAEGGEGGLPPVVESLVKVALDIFDQSNGGGGGGQRGSNPEVGERRK